MNKDDELVELMTKMYGEMQDGFKKVNGRMDKLEGRMDNFEGRLDSLENIATIIEHDHGRKLDALFDGYKQNTEALHRIEKKCQPMRNLY